MPTEELKREQDAILADEAAVLKECGRRIEAAREAQGLRQKELAEMLEVSDSTVSRWEAGYRGLGAFTVVQLAEALDVEPGALLPSRKQGRFAEIVRLLLACPPDVQEEAHEGLLHLLRMYHKRRDGAS